jgi:hypothetical protein
MVFQVSILISTFFKPSVVYNVGKPNFYGTPVLGGEKNVCGSGSGQALAPGWLWLLSNINQ